MRKPPRRQSFEIHRLMTLLLAIGAYALFSFSQTARAQEVISRSSLLALKVGEFVRLKDIIKGPVDTVCMLEQYEREIDQDIEVAPVVNAYLKVQNAKSFDYWDLWSLVFVTGERVQVQMFQPSPFQAVYKSWRPPQAPNVSWRPPPGFEVKRCVSVARGEVYKLKHPTRDHIFLALGERS